MKPIECVFFMRDVKSRTYFEQMKSRGTRVLTPTDLQAVSGADARANRSTAEFGSNLEYAALIYGKAPLLFDAQRR